MKLRLFIIAVIVVGVLATFMFFVTGITKVLIKVKMEQGFAIPLSIFLVLLATFLVSYLIARIVFGWWADRNKERVETLSRESTAFFVLHQFLTFSIWRRKVTAEQGEEKKKEAYGAGKAKTGRLPSWLLWPAAVLGMLVFAVRAEPSIIQPEALFYTVLATVLVLFGGPALLGALRSKSLLGKLAGGMCAVGLLLLAIHLFPLTTMSDGVRASLASQDTEENQSQLYLCRTMVPTGKPDATFTVVIEGNQPFWTPSMAQAYEGDVVVLRRDTADGKIDRGKDMDVRFVDVGGHPSLVRDCIDKYTGDRQKRRFWRSMYDVRLFSLCMGMGDATGGIRQSIVEAFPPDVNGRVLQVAWLAKNDGRLYFIRAEQNRNPDTGASDASVYGGMSGALKLTVSIYRNRPGAT